MRTERFIIFVLRITSEPRVKFVDRKRSLNPKVVYATDHSSRCILCGFVVYTTGRFMLSLALLFVLGFLQSF